MVFSSPTDEHAVKRHHALTTLIQQEADRRAPLSFARFMELALYTPRLGFYEQHDKSIGCEGDFFTSVSVGPLFGELLACQFADWLQKLDATQPVIVEAGAHDGQLADDILKWMARQHPKLAKRVEYWVIEPSTIRQRWQQERLNGLAVRVRWFESWTDLSSFCDNAGQPLTGIIFANELLDAMPVHRLRWNKAKQTWCELNVVRVGAGFALVDGGLSAESTAYADQVRSLRHEKLDDAFWPCLPVELLNVLPDGFTIEICPAALAWWKRASTVLNRGWLLTLDYGLRAIEFFAPQRANGTIRSYHKHRLTDDVLAEPGEQDITAHVNFSAVRLVGESASLHTAWFGSQSEFLTSILQKAGEPAGVKLSVDQVRQFQTLTHPDHLGRAFRVLVQSREINAVK